ncbi:SDR family NAD(P)-dependent oxidoreductase [Cellulomonas phragmiteti]|uniref:Short-chain dehydrogenase n=1 Tax=Cellulomonas phragmiteti TaxID=478780 RepID=A0ABQ4DN75_9CELL|nr:SDR family oxidoreductase [Cellulomonas phragmiteti]GIG40803.1 short-chain dehydrogenase [Cellulomonas phragmiteti]
MTDSSTTTSTTTRTRVALVTGGNRGLGRATALALAADGTDVVLTYRSHEDEARTVVAEVEAAGRRAVALRLDTGDVADVEGFAARLTAALDTTWGRSTLDVLVNNAGHALPTPLGSTTAADLQSLFDVHVRGVFLLTQSLVPLLVDGGRVVNVSSGLARFVRAGGHSTYGAMKAAVEALTRYWAVELGGRGITVNVVAPGPVATDFGGGAVRDTAGLQAVLASQTALGRVGQASDIGALVAAVVSPAMGWVTGQRIEASGGIAL